MVIDMLIIKIKMAAVSLLPPSVQKNKAKVSEICVLSSYAGDLI